MNNIVIDQGQLVQVKLTTAPTTKVPYKFTPVENIAQNNIRVYGVENFGATQASKTPDGDTVVANARLNQIYLTLVDAKNVEVLKDFPVYNLVRANISGFVNLFKDYQLDLTKSYIKLADVTGISLNEVVVFNWYYYFI